MAIPESLLAPGRVEIESVHQLEPRAGRRRPQAPEIEVDVEVEADAAYLLALRHPSGALTFHRPEAYGPARRGRRTGAARVSFRVPIRTAAPAPGRRGIASRRIIAVTLKILGAVADLVLPRAARALESAAFRAKGIREGWYQVTPESLGAGRLAEADLTKLSGDGRRSLLLIHGTFSDAVGAFSALARPEAEFFSRIADRYGDRMFAFNHFTVSRTPADNARALLDSMPKGRHLFDVVTHSRGGLVLRSLVERSADLGQRARDFELGHAALVASPNEGTPLAAPSRFERLVSWMANLVELFPDNPWTFAAEFLSEAVVWLSRRASGGLPGIGAMDTAGETIEALQTGMIPRSDAYSALVANYEPDAGLWRRMLDVGVDGFFGMANDLVVPTEGGWRVDSNDSRLIAATRIGCFGPGGNLAPEEPSAAHHNNIFARREAADYLVEALEGQPHGLQPVEPDTTLPYMRARRDARADPRTAMPRREPALAESSTSVATGADATFPETPRPLVGSSRRPPFMLTLLSTGKSQAANLLASFGGARAVETVRMSGARAGAGRRWREIIRMHERIKNYVDGKQGATPPSDAELIEYGGLLFETLFPGDIKRLYDVARSVESEDRLSIAFTSMVPWVADKPWEFAYDPTRETFLATEEIHFVRNVVTAVPAERIGARRGPLRILVVVAQPIGTGALSSEEEARVIRRGFEVLEKAGVADVDVLPSATPLSLHRRIQVREYDVVHFIGHGEYDTEEERGVLLFENRAGDPHRVDQCQLRQILCGRGIRLVFLNACETGRGGHAEFNKGVAPALVAGGIPAVVANQYKVLDASATTFAQTFYWSLARGHSLGEAACEARIAVNYSISGEAIDWAVPVVYTRDPREALCQPLSVAEAPTDVLPERPGRRAAARHQFRVAVADVDYSLPEIERTLERMNAVQDRFGFYLEDVSAPFGTWSRYQGSDDEPTLYVDAERVAEKLRNKPGELGADYLMCITSHPMMDSELLELYGWWDDLEEGAGVFLFSTAGFDLPARGEVTHRVLATEASTTLVAMRTDLESHTRGPKSCPLYFNEARDLELMASARRYCSRCRKSLQTDAPEDLAAVEAILEEFRPTGGE